MAIRFFFLLISALLSLQQCAERPQPTQVAVAVQPLAAEVPTGQLLRALLDTATSSPSTADAHLGLQAGFYVRAFYGAEPLPVWTLGTDSLTAAASAALTLLQQVPAYGLEPTDYAVPRLLALRDSLRQFAHPSYERQARFELYLSDAVLRFMLDLHRGRRHAYTPSPLEQTTGRVFRPHEALRAGLAAGRVPAAILACQPRHRAYRQLQAALARWLQQPVPPDSAAQYQRRYEQVALNLERWRWAAIPDSAYVLVNLPAFALYVVQGDSVVRQHRVVVGKPQTPTPTLSSQITYFTLAPDWHVPQSIATKEILPHLKADPGYLALNNYALYDSRGQQLDPQHIDWQRISPDNFRYSIRQSAGCENALGNIVFRFPNPYSVYLHDTPMRQFFERPSRAFSHGCMRLENPMQLAAYLLRREGQSVHLPSESECARQPRSQDVHLRRPMPLHVCYATCGVEEGKLRFYPDIYHQDAVLRQQLFASGPKPQALR